MKSKIIFCAVAEIREQLIPLMSGSFQVSAQIAEQLYDTRIIKHVNRWHSNVHLIIEYPYVDRVYRDSYYKYFATKMTDYQRDCIRLTLFDGPITPEEFREKRVVETLQAHYLGYLVLRPSLPMVMVRNMISPRALLHSNFLTLTANTSVTACGVKLKKERFLPWIVKKIGVSERL